MAGVSLTAVEPLPYCTLCSNHSLSNCKLLPCQHTYCEACLEGTLLMQPDGLYVLACPSCKFPVTLANDGLVGLPTIERREEEKGEREERVPPPPVCSRHNKIIQLYCETCQAIACQSCAVEDHDQHQYDAITRNQSKHREEVAGGLQEVRRKREECRESLDKLRKREDEIKSQSKEIRDEVESLSKRLVQLVETSKNNLLEQLNDIEEKKLHTLTHQKKQGEDTLNELERVSMSLENSLSLKSPHQFLTNKKMMIEIIDKVNTTLRKSSFEPVEKSDLKFKGSGSLLVMNKNIGEIHHSLIHQYCTPLATDTAIMIKAGINSLFHVTMKDNDQSPITVSPSLFTCKLHPPYEATPIDCPVEELRPGEYSINIRPTSVGIHKLSILISGQHMSRSPFTLPVAPNPSVSGYTITIIPNLRHPWGVAVGGANNEYLLVAETESHRLGLYSLNTGIKLRTIGGKGKEDGAFTDPRGVAITSTNHIIVTDYDRVQKLTISGGCVRSICGKGSGPLQFQDPKGLSVERLSGKIFIADTNNHRIQVLNNDCTYSHSFGADIIRFPWDVTCDGDGFVYVVDNEKHNILKFTSEGKFVTKFGSKGSGPGQLEWPSAIAYNSNDKHLYITDDNNHITVFDNNGAFVRHIELEENGIMNDNTGGGSDASNNTGKTGNTGNTGTGGGLKHPLGITIDGLGRLYVSDCWNNRLVIINNNNEQ